MRHDCASNRDIDCPRQCLQLRNLGQCFLFWPSTEWMIDFDSNVTPFSRMKDRNLESPQQLHVEIVYPHAYEHAWLRHKIPKLIIFGSKSVKISFWEEEFWKSQIKNTQNSRSWIKKKHQWNPCYLLKDHWKFSTHRFTV